MWIFDLHDAKEDKTVRDLVRVYFGSKKRTYNKDELSLKILNAVRYDLKNKYGADWIKIWLKKIDYNIAESTVYDWINGRAPIPILAIKSLYNLVDVKLINKLLKNVKYLSTTTGEVTKVPDISSSEFLYFCGLILGDGCLPIIKKGKDLGYDYRIEYYSKDINFLKKVYIPLFFKLFESKINGPKPDHSAWKAYKRNKIVYRILTKVIKIANGKKAKKAKIPTIIKNMNPLRTIPFLTGLVDSDIGSHSKSVGGTFRSKEFVKDLKEHFKRLDIETKISKVYYKDGIYPQYGFVIRKNGVKKLVKLMLTKNLPKRRDRRRLLLKIAGVPEPGQTGKVQDLMA